MSPSGTRSAARPAPAPPAAATDLATRLGPLRSRADPVAVPAGGEVARRRRRAPRAASGDRTTRNRGWGRSRAAVGSTTVTGASRVSTSTPNNQAALRPASTASGGRRNDTASHHIPWSPARYPSRCTYTSGSRRIHVGPRSIVQVSSPSETALLPRNGRTARRRGTRAGTDIRAACRDGTVTRCPGTPCERFLGKTSPGLPYGREASYGRPQVTHGSPVRTGLRGGLGAPDRRT